MQFDKARPSSCSSCCFCCSRSSNPPTMVTMGLTLDTKRAACLNESDTSMETSGCSAVICSDDDVTLTSDTLKTGSLSKPSFSSGLAPLLHRPAVGQCIFPRYLKIAKRQLCAEQDEQIKPALDPKHCKVTIGDSELLVKKIEEAVAENKRILDRSRLELKFDSEWKPLLVPRFLILPKDLTDPSTNFLHHQYCLANKRVPDYISAYELMVHSERILDPEERARFTNKIISSRVFVLLDWDSNIGNIETLYYDRGIKETNDVSEFYKGEIDASYHDGPGSSQGNATISAIIWKGDKAIYAEIFKNITCVSIHEAEANAVLALCFKCFEFGIKNLVIWTDNKDIHEAISGALTVTSHRKDRDVLLLLGRICIKFNRLISMCKRREQLFLADNLAQYPEKPMFMDDVMEKWEYELRGKALFRLSQSSAANKVITRFKVKPYKRLAQTKCFMEINHLSKLEAISIIKETLLPGPLFLAVDNLEEKPKDFLSQVELIAGSNKIHKSKTGDCSLVHLGGKEDRRKLLVVVDATIPHQCYDHLGCFTIILVEPGERALCDPRIEEASALTYVYFNGVLTGAIDAGKK